MDTAALASGDLAASAYIGSSILEPWLMSFPGKVGNVRIWASQLSVVDIQASMIAPKAPEELAITHRLLMDMNSMPLNITVSRQKQPTFVKGFPDSYVIKQLMGTLSSNAKANVVIVVPHRSWRYDTVYAVSRRIFESGSCCNVTLLHTFQHAVPRNITQPQQHRNLAIKLVSNADTGGDLRTSWSQAVLRGMQDPSVATSDFTVLLDPNIITSKGWLQSLVASMKQQPRNVAAVHSRVLYPDGSISSMGIEFQVCNRIMLPPYHVISPHNNLLDCPPCT